MNLQEETTICSYKVIQLTRSRVVDDERESGSMTDQDFADAELVARLAERDEAALEPLYDRYGKIVYSVAMRILRDAQAAEEVTQEVFVRLWNNAASFESTKGYVRVWILRITHNLALNEVRRRQSRPVIAANFDWPTESEHLLAQDTSGDPEMATWLRERATVIRHALEQLPLPQRQSIELAFFGGLSQAEVAAALGEPLGTIKSRVRIGMRRLRDILVGSGIDAEAIEAQQGYHRQG